MSVELISAEFALLVYLEPSEAGDATEVDLRAFSGVLAEAHFAPDSDRYISAREQMSIVFDPPSAEIIDHSGAMSARSRTVAAATRVVETFEQLGYEMYGHGWRIEGRVREVRPEHVAASMLNSEQLHKLSRRGDPSKPKLVLLGLEIPSRVTEEIMFTVRHEDDEAHIMALSLTKRPLAFADAEAISERFAAEVNQMLTDVLM